MSSDALCQKIQTPLAVIEDMRHVQVLQGVAGGEFASVNAEHVGDNMEQDAVGLEQSNCGTQLFFRIQHMFKHVMTEDQIAGMRAQPVEDHGDWFLSNSAETT